MTKNTTLLTPKWLSELQDELKNLKEVRRIDIADKLKEAISYGDLSENAEYQEARDEQAQVELRISELEEMLKPWNYEIINEKGSKQWINVGSIVTVMDTSDNDSFTYTIVWSQEANILENKISNESPLGRALIGKKQNDTIQFDSPSGNSKYSITKVA